MSGSPTRSKLDQVMELLLMANYEAEFENAAGAAPVAKEGL
jgi:hypothetical protein